MFEPKTQFPKPDRPLLNGQSLPDPQEPRPQEPSPQEPKQRRMMVVALILLLVALGTLLYRDRDFWFPDTQEALDDPPAQSGTATAMQPALGTTSTPAADLKQRSAAGKRQPSRNATPSATNTAMSTATPTAQPASDSSGATIARTVLPPLEVEVVAGDTHRTIHPGSNSVRVDLQPGSAPQAVSVPATTDTTQNTARLTNAAERVQMSADTAEIVSRPVKPGYPLLARQMKVQGSVILQALIGRDGDIQGLHVVSGPPILASAAQEAVRQWRFRPHYLGSESVETQAKITVNFTISTN